VFLAYGNAVGVLAMRLSESGYPACRDTVIVAIDEADLVTDQLRQCQGFGHVETNTAVAQAWVASYDRCAQFVELRTEDFFKPAFLHSLSDRRSSP